MLRIDSEELLWRKKHQLSSGFCNSADSLPGAQDAAGGEGSDIGSVGKLFVGQVNTDAVRGLAPKPVRERNEHMSKSLLCAVGHQACVGSEIPCQIVCCDGERIVQQSGNPGCEGADRAPRPNQQAAV